jgi:hypothetical protein
MGYRTIEVELENGRVSPTGNELLPGRAHALLTLLDHVSERPLTVAQSCDELGKRWQNLKTLTCEEGCAFANDIEAARADIPPLTSSWE